MSNTFFIDLAWKNEKNFNYAEFNRDHLISFEGGQVLKNSAAPDFLGNAQCSNPEELLVSALASCHMLTFLVIAAKSGYLVDSYNDHAIATLDKNEEQKLSITIIDLKPIIVFTGEKIPTSEQLQSMHEKAHKNCFIANSIKSKVNIHS